MFYLQKSSLLFCRTLSNSAYPDQTPQNANAASDQGLYWLISECSIKIKPVHEISNNVVCATSKASDQPAHTHSLIKALASRLCIL